MEGRASMTARLLQTQNQPNFPSFVWETLLLRQFAKEPSACVAEKETDRFGNKHCWAKAQTGNIAGFGHAESKRLALVKAVAEFYERRLMYDVFAHEFSLTPRCLQTSNGFAVHLSEEQACANAKLEAVERHLLQISHFRDGWSGFKLFDTRQVNDFSLTLLTTKYTISGYQAGMVMARSPRFKGVSFGYFADRVENISSSPRWSHAIAEAIDKIEPFLSLANADSGIKLQPIEAAILDWMTTPHDEPKYSTSADLRYLPEPDLEIKVFDLQDRWALEFPFFGAFCRSENLLPLIVPGRIQQHDQRLVAELFLKFQLPASVPARSPVL